MKPESTWTAARPDCPHPERWHSPDVMGTELEVSGFIGGLVKALQPDLVLETGSYKGQTTLLIAYALYENRHGRLVTIEQDRALAADTRLAVAGRAEFVEVMACPSLAVELAPSEQIDLAFFDSGPGLVRIDEFEHFSRWMHEGTIVLFHDVSPANEILRNAVIDLADRGRLGVVFLPTPRGLAVCEFFR